MSGNPRSCIPEGRRSLAFLFLCGLTPWFAGCLNFCHPLPACSQQPCPPPLPRCCQQHVYIFFLTGLDPLDCANLNGVAEYCHALGYNATYLGQLLDGHNFEDEIHLIYHDDPNARFVLIGFSFGANAVRAVANHLYEDGNIPVDLMVYLGGNTIYDTPDSKPPNVKKLVNILAAGCIWNGDWLSMAENHHVTDVWHFGSPTHNVTLEKLSLELAEIAGTVPYFEPVMPPPEELPVTPRPVTPPPPAPLDEWDFLHPVHQLQPLGVH